MYSRRQSNRNRMLREAEKDLADLRAEVETEEQMKEMLDISIAELQETLLTLEQDLENADIGEEDEWKVRYYTQMEVNNQLQQQKDWLKSKVETSKNQSHEDDYTALLADLDLDSLNENQLLRYLRQLEKDRNALYNELRDTEWKLDKESKTFHKYNDTRNAYMTEITEVMMNLEALRSRLKNVESSETGSLQKCPRHLKYLNILPDQRVIDPKKGPIKKIATVRSLPKLDSTPDEDIEETPEEVKQEESNDPEA